MLLQFDKKVLLDLDALVKAYRKTVEKHLKPIVASYHPDLIHEADYEYRKMIELSTKMTLVGHACTEIAGYSFDDRRQMISSLFGGCCFISDSFLDDFDDATTREYLKRFELLLIKGWFDIENDREQLFYVIISRLFAERNILDPMLRQAIFSLFLAQKRDVELRIDDATLRTLSRRKQLRFLKECARNRSGHAIIVLSRFLVPELSLLYHHLLFTAGALIMHIDDYGDYHSDLYYNRVTYMNQLRNPEQTLRRIFYQSIVLLHEGLPKNNGRELLIGFLYRYYLTRLKKHRLEKDRGENSWIVYE